MPAPAPAKNITNVLANLPFVNELLLSVFVDFNRVVVVEGGFDVSLD